MQQLIKEVNRQKKIKQMKKIALMFIVFSFIFSCNSSRDKTYTIKTIQYELGKNDKINGNGEVIEENQYADGKLLRKTLYDSSASIGLVKKSTYIYTYKGEDSIYLLMVDKKISTRTDYHRDKFGNILSAKSYDLLNPSDTVNIVYSNTLNEDSLTASTSILSNIPELPTSNLIEYSYDKQNRIIEQKMFTISDTGKALNSIYQKEYDEKGNNILLSNYNLLQNFTSKTEYLFNAQNNMIEESYLENGELIYKINYQYSGYKKIEGTKTYPLSGKKFTLKFIYE